MSICFFLSRKNNKISRYNGYTSYKIGDDGAKGLFELYKAKAQCVAENEESAIVYGMPKEQELNPQLLTLNLANIKLKLESFFKGK